MKTIMSSYHCEPDRGSEFETGWQEMLRLATECPDLVVVTRSFSSEKAGQALKETKLAGVRFYFFDLPHWIASLEQTSIGMQLVPYLWEIALFFFLLKRYSRNCFDHAHRASVGSYRFPSLLWYFAPYFTWGPIAGGEIVPVRFLSVFSWKGRMFELVRLVIQHAAFLDPLVLISLYKAKKIGVATTATLTILPAFARKKAYLQANYYKKDNQSGYLFSSYASSESPRLQLLHIGRLLEWKGLMLTLKALRQVNDRMDYELNIIGDGPGKAVFQHYVEKYQLRVSFLGTKTRQELASYYQSHDVFISTDFHGRGSNTMVEAKAHRLPVLALDITDPDHLTGEELMVVVNTQHQSVEQVVANIADALLELYSQKKNKQFIL